MRYSLGLLAVFALSAVLLIQCGEADLCEDVDCNDDNECTEDVCNPVDGSCSHTALTDGTACTLNGDLGQCVAGVCTAGCEGVDCDDGNPCTEDGCSAADGTCSHPTAADGTACPFGEYPGQCSAGVCVGLCEGVECNDENQCTEDICNQADGTCSNINLPDGAQCDFDGFPGVCWAGACVDAQLCRDVDCSDDNDCTDDVCDPMDGSCSNPNKVEGAVCEIDDYPGRCSEGRCTGLCEGVDCSDGNECTIDLCDPSNGSCTNPPEKDGTECDFEGHPGVCSESLCVSVCELGLCDDGNECTDDVCDPLTGTCHHPSVADDTACDFGGSPGLCKGGVCEDAKVCEDAGCDDGNPCTNDECDPADGSCEHPFVENGTECNLGEPGTCITGTCEATLEAVLEPIRLDHGVPALAAMAVHQYRLVEMAATGARAVGYPEQTTEHDLWHIGSLTKAMTATLAAVLVERGVVSWDSTVGEVLPDLVGSMQEVFVDVRLDELLYHTAGLVENVSRAPSWSSLFTDQSPIIEQRRRFAAELLALPPDSERGTYNYTNAGYIVAGAMLEELTGESWEALVRREVFDRLGMESTGFGAPGSSSTRDQPWGHHGSAGYYSPVAPGPYADNPAALGPAGTVHVSLADYAEFMIEHLAGARGEGELVSAGAFEKLHTPSPGSRYALGWVVEERVWANGRVLLHVGSNNMWRAVVWLAPERNLGFYAVTNAADDASGAATEAAVDALIARFEAVQ